ncbi:hypothetical protein PVAND_014483 [Polypedilum vanderplanki]|uniref:Uncharacterized protein n=1 Tax=Polypedilum vanderplanki TaxID=319348 RepID=A0A9J6BA44_POLVA|nr:hypothetical protein PVAND_014483 [Polypedilum vanderplanki]
MSNVLMASCYNVSNLPAQIINTLDCINGSLLTNKVLLSDMSNFSYLMHLHLIEAKLVSQIAPIDTDLTISNDSRLMINLEGCVNTLRDDCKKFFRIYAKNRADYNAKARFPCFYSPIDTSFAVQQFDLENEYQQFMIGFTVPVALLIISCTVLVICQQSVVVGDDSKMKFKCTIANDEGNLNETNEEKTNNVL